MIEHIPERAESSVTNNYYVKTQKPATSGVLIDWVLTIILIIVMLFISVSYFAEFGGSLEVSFKKAAIDTAWVGIAMICVKELGRYIFKRKGQRTEQYIDSQKKAKKAIRTLNENVHYDKGKEYCNVVTRNTVQSYRCYQLSTVGLDIDTFNAKYLGKSVFYLIACVFRREISIVQAKVLRRCNHLKTKQYNPKFITSYSAENNIELVPSQLNDAKKADMEYSIRSLIGTALTAFGVGFAFNDLYLNFSKEMLFLAIIKIILLIVMFAVSAIKGWYISLIEQSRNESIVSEVKTCMQYVGVDVGIIKSVEDEEPKESN